MPEVWDDEFVNLQGRYKRGVFSFETALFLWDLSDRSPNRYHMTFPGTYNLTSPKSEGVICSGAKEPFYSMGIIAKFLHDSCFRMYIDVKLYK